METAQDEELHEQVGRNSDFDDDDDNYGIYMIPGEHTNTKGQLSN